MTADRKCAECGSAIPHAATDGICTQCLFSLGLEPPEATGPIPTPPDIGPLLASATPAIGVKFHSFGDYELLEEIARGGMGVVFKARQISLNRLVALKLISAGAPASAELVKRFKAEAEAAASLSHPNIVPIYEIGEHQGHHYFSMKLVIGGTLVNRIPKEPTKRPSLPFDLRPSARVICQVARAVHYAHQRGVLHRDLKPGNILMDAQGEPHLTDFGLAKLVEEQSALTHTNAVLGTPAYMAPEQARGGTKDVTTAADIYGLGAVLYETLTGSPPFGGGTSLETIRQVLDQEPQRPSFRNPNVDRELETICLKCLEKDPARRYTSAAALADDLQRWLHHIPILARRASLFERLAKWAHRQPVLALAVVLLHLALATGLAGILWHWRQAVVARQAEAGERQRAIRAEADALARLREAKLNYVRANRLTGRPGQRFDSLAELSRADVRTGRLDLRNEAIACLALPDVRPLKEWAKTPRWDSFRFNASHRHYATNDDRGNLTIRDTETDAFVSQIPVQGGKALASFVAFSADDRWVATLDPVGHARLWNRAQSPQAIDLPRGTALIEFTPDSRTLVVNHVDGSLHFLNATNGTEEKSLQNSLRPPWNTSWIRFDSSGDRFLTLAEGQAAIHRASDGKPLRTLTAPGGVTTGFALAVWHPDGRRIAASWLNTTGLWDVETGRQLGLFTGHEGMIVGLTFAGTGEYLASASWDGTTRLWHTDTQREALRWPESGNSLSVSRDGRRLSFQSWDNRQVKLYELPDLTALKRLTLPPQRRHVVHHTGQAAFSPDGELIAAPDHDGVYIFHGRMPAPVALLPVVETYSVCFAADGGTLFTGGASSAQRWPMRWSADRSELHLGPPEVIEPTRGLPVTHLDLSRDGHWLAALAKTNVIFFQIEPATEVAQFKQSLRLGSPPLVSPDGRWLTTVTSSRDRIEIWNGRTGALVTNLPTLRAWQPEFSPDGHWLACSQNDSTTVWDSAEWRPRYRIAHAAEETRHGLAFSPDGQILATFASDWQVRLLRFETGQELARFPAGRATTSVRFSPQGDQLAVANESGYVELWDLRRVREELASLNLDWDLPRFPPDRPVSTTGALRVIVHP